MVWKILKVIRDGLKTLGQDRSLPEVVFCTLFSLDQLARRAAVGAGQRRWSGAPWWARHRGAVKPTAPSPVASIGHRAASLRLAYQYTFNVYPAKYPSSIV